MSSRHLMVGVYMCEVHRESGLLQTIFSFFFKYQCHISGTCLCRHSTSAQYYLAYFATVLRLDTPSLKESKPQDNIYKC